MKAFVCSQCGANEWTVKNGERICQFCGTPFLREADERQVKQSEISLSDDVERLLEKCRKDPKKARKYANLILDVDPSNREALKYL